MAVILEKIFAQNLSIPDVVHWLLNGNCSDKKAFDILSETQLQAEFLPYFINSIRDQTAHLVCRGSTSVSSPARTPSSLQKLTRAPHPRPQRSGGSKANRTQLFASDCNHSNWSDRDFTPVSQSSAVCCDTSVVSTPVLRSDGKRNKTISGSGGDSGSKRKTPGSGSRKDDSMTLAQFLVTPESQTRGKGRKSPFGESRFDNSASYRSSSNSKRRSGSRGKQSGQSEHSGSKGHTKCKLIETPPVFDLSSAQDFPPVGSPSPKDSTPSRRITPTVVTSSGGGKRISTFPSLVTPSQDNNPADPPVIFNSAFSLPLSNASTQDSYSKNVQNTLEKERQLLKLERIRHKNQPDSSPFLVGTVTQSPKAPPPQTPTKLPRCHSMSSVSDTIQPDVEKVSYQQKLDLLAQLYATCLQECLVPNLTVELYFLIQLLTAKGSKLEEEEGVQSLDDDIEDVNYLSSIHNCAYFATSVLHRLSVLLSLLDKGTLRLLAENPVVSQFSPKLKSELEQATKRCPKESCLQAAITSPMQVVPFLADTDNRQNFPSDGSFHSFKKQRDHFYDLLRDWQENHTKPGWRMQDKLAYKIRDLVRQMDIANYTHFARLFQSQLIRMCQGDSSVVDSGDSHEFSFIQQLRRTNPEKFKRLEERFFTPATSGSPCPPPSFHGCQEFFKDFILAADSYTFNQHLTNSFAAKVIELNELQLGISEQVETTPVSVDEEQRDSYSSCLLALRVLAKFLGFLVFLPYQGRDRLPDTVRDNIIAMRNKAPPPVDVLSCLMMSDVHHRLILTLPWIVEYLNMMDPVAALLQHYHKSLSLLADIHKRVSSEWSENPASHNHLLILLLLGWLFENSALPGGLHFTSGADIARSAVFAGNPGIVPGADQALDHLPLVDRHILYTCCPFLGDLRGLLAEASIGVNNRSIPVKKITPVSVDEPVNPGIPENQIQVELEKNFFQTHSTSLKKSVEFVSGRVASNCIKFIDASLVSGARARIPRILKALLDSSSTSEKEKDAFTQQAKQAGQDLSQETQELARTEAKKFIRKKCKSALEMLLPCDTTQQVLETGSSIATRLAYERTGKWISTQIPGALQQEVNSQLQKSLKSQTGQTKKDSVTRKVPPKAETHDKSGLSPSLVIQHLKDCVRNALMPVSSHDVTVEDIYSAINDVSTMMNNRQDLTPLAYQSIHQLTVELCAALASRYPEYLTMNVNKTCGDTMAVPVGLAQKSVKTQGSGESKRTWEAENGLSNSDQMAESLPPTTSGEVTSDRTSTQCSDYCHVNGSDYCHVNGSDSSIHIKDGYDQTKSIVQKDMSSIAVRKSDRLNSELSSQNDAQAKMCNMTAAQRETLLERGAVTILSSDGRSSNVNGDPIVDSVGVFGSVCLVSSVGVADDRTINQSTVLDSLLAMWSCDFSPKVPVEAFLSPRTAWVISHFRNRQACWQCIANITDKLITHSLADRRSVQSAVNRLMMSSHIQPMTEATAAALLSVLSVTKLDESQEALDVLRSLCTETTHTD